MREDILLRIKPLVESHLERGGYIAADLRFYKNQTGSLVLEILADREQGGITLDECARQSRELGVMLEESGLLDFRYTLDVSSPGLDRPMRTAADFRRAQGRKIRVFLKEPVEGRIEYDGTLESMADQEIHVVTNHKTIVIPLDKVNKAKQVIL